MISVIIPTYNEVKNIKEIIIRVGGILNKNYEIIVVDDNSEDGTANLARSLSKRYNVKVFIRKDEKDLSTAVIFGFKKAKGDIIGAIDADLSHPPKIIPKLLASLKKGECDISIGSRLIKGGRVENWPITRRWISIFATVLTRPLTKVKDPLSGFFFIKKSKLNFSLLKPKGYKILLDILVRQNIDNFKEVPYTFRNRMYGTSKINIKVILKYLIHLFELYLYKIFSYFRG